MSNEPILAETTIEQHGKKYNLKAKGGLHFIKSNGKPHFTVTFEQRLVGSNRVDSCGADGAHIVANFPQLADLAALHLSDIDGVPMHAEGNGWYWLAGAVGGLGERFHGGSGTSARTPEECAVILGEHLRLDGTELTALIQTATERQDDPAGLRVLFDAFVNTLKVRWEAEAAACRAKHGLVIFGDTYVETKPAA